MLMLLFCIAFGLSMDYEVIVLSRIKELHDQGCDNRTAVTDGLSRSGRIVTTAAALIAVTFFAFGTATVSFLQLFGIGAGFAVIIDATLVRAVLLPACQRILGRAAWYAPAPLRRLQTRIGLAEAPGRPPRPPAPATTHGLDQPQAPKADLLMPQPFPRRQPSLCAMVHLDRRAHMIGPANRTEAAAWARQLGLIPDTAPQPAR